jgi:hypothetical protein
MRPFLLRNPVHADCSAGDVAAAEQEPLSDCCTVSPRPRPMRIVSPVFRGIWSA